MQQRRSFYFSDGPYLQTLQGLYAALSEPEAFIKLLGNAKTGKSTLCKKLTQFLRRKEHRVIFFSSAIESPDMLRSLLARELNLPDSSNFARLLEDALANTDEKPLILIFDDAHLLTDITLMEIYRLAEVQQGQRRLLSLIMCGEPSLDQRLLSKQEFNSLLLHISHRFVLEPMDLATLAHFFHAYADRAGAKELQLEATAMTFFYKSCKGYPGPALSMSRLIVESRLGQADSNPVGKAELVRIFKNEAAGGPIPGSGLGHSFQWRAFGSVAVVLVIASIGFLYQQINSAVAPLQTIAPAQEQSVAAPVASPFQEQEQEQEVAATAPAQSVTVEPELEVEAQAQIQAQAEENVAQAPALLITTSSNPEQLAARLEPVSDSSLVLVTAAEVGIAQEDITMPEYEDLQAMAASLAAQTPSNCRRFR